MKQRWPLENWPRHKRRLMARPRVYWGQRGREVFLVFWVFFYRQISSVFHPTSSKSIGDDVITLVSPILNFCSSYFSFKAFIGGMGAAPTQQDESTGTDVSVLCTECPAGTGVARLCAIKGRANPFAVDHPTAAQNVTEDEVVVEEEDEEEEEEMATKCEPCVNGATFSDSASRHSPCRACRTCPANSRVKRECNATHDTECECDRDHYQEMSYQQTVVTNDLADEGVDADSLAPTTATPHARHRHGAFIHQQQPEQPVMSCKSCDLCPHGYGAARACSSTHNTICRKCPTSTYSSVLSATHGCSVCTVCRDDQVTLNECTPIQDTVCAGRTKKINSHRLHLIGTVILKRKRNSLFYLARPLVSSEMLTLITSERKKQEGKMWNRVRKKTVRTEGFEKIWIWHPPGIHHVVVLSYSCFYLFFCFVSGETRPLSIIPETGDKAPLLLLLLLHW